MLPRFEVIYHPATFLGWPHYRHPDRARKWYRFIYWRWHWLPCTVGVKLTMEGRGQWGDFVTLPRLHTTRQAVKATEALLTKLLWAWWEMRIDEYRLEEYGLLREDD